jgi:hypothetical protein
MRGVFHFNMSIRMDQLTQLTTLGVRDIPTFAGIVICYGVYRYAITYGFLVRLSRILRLKAGMRFVFRSFDLIHYTVSLCLGLWAMTGRPYDRCILWAKDCQVPLFPTIDAFICTTLEKVYYMLFCAYYVVDVLFIWTVPHDMIALTCHHAATIAMVLFAVAIRVPGIAFSVMVLHDAVDVPLYLAKVAGYLGWRWVKDAGMVTFVLTCTWFRMINFPLVIFHTWRNLPQVPHYRPLYGVTVSLLTVLFVLHLYWYWKVLKGIVALFSEGEKGLRDRRSD